MAAKKTQFTTQQLIDYIVAGGSISDLVGSNIAQGSVLKKLLADPRVLSTLAQQIASSGQATFDPSKTYTTAAPTFEAANNTVRLSYTNRKPVEAAIAKNIFDAIDAGQDPITAVAAIDDDTLKPFGVKKSDVAGLIGDLTKDAPKYVDAKATQNAASSKQQYNAWLAQTGGTGTASGLLSSRLGIPTLSKLTDPTKGYSVDNKTLSQSEIFTNALKAYDARFSKSRYAPSKEEITAAKAASAGLKDQSVRPDDIQQRINAQFNPNSVSNFQIPLLGKKYGEIRGTGWLRGLANKTVNLGLGLAGAASTGGGFNPLQGDAWNTDNLGFVKEADKKIQEKAYNDYLKNTKGAINQKMLDESQKRIADRAAKIINDRFAKLAEEKGITPFTVGARDVVGLLGTANLNVKKK